MLETLLGMTLAELEDMGKRSGESFIVRVAANHVWKARKLEAAGKSGADVWLRGAADYLGEGV